MVVTVVRWDEVEDVMVIFLTISFVSKRKIDHSSICVCTWNVGSFIFALSISIVVALDYKIKFLSFFLKFLTTWLGISGLSAGFCMSGVNHLFEGLNETR